MAEKVIGRRILRSKTIKFVDEEEWLKFKEIAFRQMRKRGLNMSLWEYFNEVIKTHNRRKGEIG